MTIGYALLDKISGGYLDTLGIVSVADTLYPTIPKHFVFSDIGAALTALQKRIRFYPSCFIREFKLAKVREVSGSLYKPAPVKGCLTMDFSQKLFAVCGELTGSWYSHGKLPSRLLNSDHLHNLESALHLYANASHVVNQERLILMYVQPCDSVATYEVTSVVE